MPRSSSSTVQTNWTGPGSSTPDRDKAAIAMIAAARPPFMSVAPRPKIRPASTVDSNGSRVHPSPAGTTSEWPRTMRPGALPVPGSVAVKFGLPGATSQLSTMKPSS